MRINKYISSSGFCSRRAAETYINEGRVTINGEQATLGSQVADGDLVTLDGKTIEPTNHEIYIMLNKPIGITCTSEPDIKGNIIDFLKFPERIFPIGRLDKDSTGLIVLTNNGDIVNEVLREENGHHKTYRVRVDKRLTPEFIQSMSEGVKIYNPVRNEYVMTKPCTLRRIDDFQFEITICQGYNRQIRRMCTALSYRVHNLQRTTFLNLDIKGLSIGKWRRLNEEEISKFKDLAKID